MANVAAQSAEEFTDRVIYRYPACRFEQTPGNVALSLSVGLKTLTNTTASTSFVIPASGISAKMYRVEWCFVTSVQVSEFSHPIGNTLIRCGFNQLIASSLNYDGKPLQTKFYKNTAEVFVISNQLRAINITDLQVEPLWSFGDLQFTGGVASGYLQWTDATVALVALMQPTVTFYKK